MKRILKGIETVNKGLLRKIDSGIKDEMQAIAYYASFTPKQRKELTKQERKNITDAKEDEKEHLRYLKKDKETLGRMR